MRILNKTDEVLILKLSAFGCDDRIEEVKPGKESDDFIGMLDGDNTGEGADVIEISKVTSNK